jgi:Leucine-rich repeat (LRR) protein
MRILFLFSVLLFLIDEIQAESCLDYACDSSTVRQILDYNGLDTVNVKNVTGVHNNRIDSLNLTGKGIRVLPAALGNLSSLKYLFLGCIRFSGVARDPICNSLDSLPEEIGKLSELVGLNLDGNNLVKLPSSIGGLKKLSGLILEHNNLASLPAAIGELTELNSISLGYNPLLTLPDEIGALRKLRYFNLYATDIQKLPNTIGNWSNLQYIIIANTELTTLPNEFGKLTALVQAELYRNKLTSLPDSIVKLNNLQYLFVEYNRLCSPSNDIIKWLDKYDAGWEKWQDCSSTIKTFKVANQPLSVITSNVKSIPGLIEISYNLSKNSHIKIEIFNTQGKLLYRVIDGYKTAGFHYLKLSTNSIIRGFIFVRITGDFSVAVRNQLIPY